MQDISSLSKNQVHFLLCLECDHKHRDLHLWHNLTRKKNRHNGISFAILAQSVKSIPKNIRLNCNVFFVGKFASKKVVLEDLYEEVSNVLTLEEFEELYDKATEEQYGSLIIDCSHKDKRFMRGLDTQLLIK